MKIKRTKEELKALAKISRKCSLVRIFMMSSKAERSLEATSHEDVEAEINFEGSFIKREDQYVYAKAGLELYAKPVGTEEKVVTIGSEYMLVYKLENDAEYNKEELESFCDINAIYNAWPFFREFILSTSNRMSIPPLVLPLLSISPKSEKSRQEKEKKTGSLKES